MFPATTADELMPQFSPDGRFVAVQRVDSGEDRAPTHGIFVVENWLTDVGK